MTELRTLDWLWRPGYVQRQQMELIVYLHSKFRYEAQIPHIAAEAARSWYWTRHRNGYRTEIGEEGRLRFVPEQAAWDLIYEDMALCRSYFASGDEEKQKAAFEIAANNVQRVEGTLNDSHAARLMYEGFLLPYLYLANPEIGKWPDQRSLLCGAAGAFSRDAPDIYAHQFFRMTIRYGDGYFDRRLHGATPLGQVMRYVFGDFLKTRGRYDQAARVWREITDAGLRPGAQTLAEELRDKE